MEKLYKGTNFTKLMPTLLEILRTKGISNPGNRTGDVKRIVAESVDELLHFEPVVTSAQIGSALEADGTLGNVLRSYIPDYMNPSGNRYFLKVPNLRYLRLKAAIKKMIKKESSRIHVTFETPDSGNGKRLHYNTVLFYRDVDKLRSYIRSRLQAGTGSYVFCS